MSSAFVTYQDYSKEFSTARVTAQTLTALNFDTQATARAAFIAAISPLVLGTIAKSGFGEQTIGVNTPPASVEAQREKKWLVTYEGNTSGKKFQLELPCADLTGGHLIVNSDNADLTEADWAAFIAAFEAYGRSPDDPAETINVLSARFVGRNL